MLKTHILDFETRCLGMVEEMVRTASKVSDLMTYTLGEIDFFAGAGAVTRETSADAEP